MWRRGIGCDAALVEFRSCGGDLLRRGSSILCFVDREAGLECLCLLFAFFSLCVSFPGSLFM